MKRLALMLALLFAAGATLPAQAETLRIRLVRASNAPGGVHPSLQDVAPALRGNLVFTSYALVGQARLTLPAGGTANLGGYAVACQGAAGQLHIAIANGGRRLLDTTAGIQPGKPLILGSFPDGSGGQMIFVFTVE